MSIFSLEQHVPVLANGVYVAPHATVLGQVILHEDVSIWPGAVIRADDDRIIIDEGSNVQDGAILHVDPGHPLTVGRNVTIGHAAVLHGCSIGAESLIGIHATVLNDAVIGAHSIVGAGALVPEGKTFPDRSLLIGAPARVARELRPDEIEGILRNAENYRRRAQRFRRHLAPLL
jgi:carbonic anhydrase/acetyltransferase-like protein (isoleucine patch superfamily)